MRVIYVYQTSRAEVFWGKVANRFSCVSMSAGMLTDVHRMFLQVMMSRRVLSDREIRQVYSRLEPGGTAGSARDRTVNFINVFHL